MKALEVFNGSDGEVTKNYYGLLLEKGQIGRVAVCAFRAQKTSTRAKLYRGSRYRGAAYETKNWSMDQLCKALEENPQLEITYGWKRDDKYMHDGQPMWILYVDLPTGQVSWHSPGRLTGPDYPGEWDQKKISCERVLAFCDMVMDEKRESPPTLPQVQQALF